MVTQKVSKRLKVKLTIVIRDISPPIRLEIRCKQTLRDMA